MTAPRTHPLAVSPFARLADRAIARIWRSGIDDKPPLDPAYLWQVGSRGYSPEDERGGRSDEDVSDFRERLNRLCTSLDQEAGLNALGHTLAYGQLTAAIRKRHALGRLWRERPHVAEVSIAPPIIVVGQMRSGTTRIHRLLAADPALAATRFCDALDPLPRRIDLRPAKAAAALWLARRVNPWLDTLHPFGATRPDEEIGWLSAALSPCAYEAQWHVPAFTRWSEERDPAPVYREFARILRTDAHRRDNAARPRVLKCPQFSEDLATLLAEFDGARVVRARRDSRAVVASSVSLVASQTAFQSRRAEVEQIESEWRRKIALRERRTDAALAGWNGPLVETRFDALNEDWQSAMRRMYRDLGLPLSARALARMRREVVRNADGPHRRHAAVIEAFAAG